MSVTITGAPANIVVASIITGGISEAPSDGQTYGRASGAWHSINPQNVTLPTITGTAVETATLHDANTDNWTGSPTSFLRQWQRGSGASWTNISGATASTYTLVLADVGYQIRMIKSAINLVGQSLPFSEATPTATVTEATLLTSLLSYYGLADLTDSSGNGNDLTDTGGTTLTTQGGINGALFDGSGATYLANPTLSLGSVWSFSYWIYVVDNTSNNQYPIAGGIGAAAGTQLVFVLGDRVVSHNWLSDEFTGANYGQFQSVSEGAWHHHLIIGDSTNGLRWFIDGTKITIGSHVYDLTKTGFMLGQDNVAQAFHGLIGPTSLWNRALTSGEVTSLYNAGAPLPLSSYAATV